jgi:tetratricopeptide (TPR) repeat protein
MDAAADFISTWAPIQPLSARSNLLNLHRYRRGLLVLHVSNLRCRASLFLRVVVAALCLQCTFATLLLGQAPDPVSEAEHLMKRGQPDKALELLNPLSATAPEPKGAEYLRGLILYEKGDLQEAASAFAKASTQDPADLEAMKMQGASLFRLGKAADAIPLLERAKGSTQQMNVDPQYVLGLCYLDTNRFDDARHAFAAQYEFSPDSASAYLLEGRMLLRRQYLPAAEKATQKALELKPDVPSAHMVLGQIALARNDLPEALSQFVMERNLNPMFGAVYDGLGDAYLRSGDYVNAQKSLDRAVLLEPTLNIPYILLGKVMLEEDDAMMATMYLKHAIEIDPKNSMAHALLGRAYRSLGRTEDAAAELHTAATLQETAQPAPGQSK